MNWTAGPGVAAASEPPCMITSGTDTPPEICITVSGNVALVGTYLLIHMVAKGVSAIVVLAVLVVLVVLVVLTEDDGDFSSAKQSSATLEVISSANISIYLEAEDPHLWAFSILRNAV